MPIQSFSIQEVVCVRPLSQEARIHLPQHIGRVVAFHPWCKDLHQTSYSVIFYTEDNPRGIIHKYLPEDLEKVESHQAENFDTWVSRILKDNKDLTMKEPITKDSGERRSFSTGSVRDAATGKGRYDLVSPIALRRLAQLYERGAVKYDPRNWEKGQPLSVFMDCAMRHLQKHLMGYRDEDHMAAAMWNVAGFIHVEDQVRKGLLPEELDDMPCFVTPDEALEGHEA